MNEIDMNENQVLKKHGRGTEYIETNGEITAKRCSGCGEMMELEHFANLKKGLGCTHSKCRACLKEYGERYNRQKRGYSKTYYEKNRELVLKRARESYARKTGR
ncbi:hypothetical protein [Peribacillus frigoritolerans]|uniref:hypothetical protein n=1 Tax=Peribacillus frigoritolerans TaxID=450367 RepID=UPI001DC86E81|nr:hypothetical protein [Listeria monocytogenes]